MSIAESYRAMSGDIRRAAEAVKNEDVRRAYLTLAEIWWTRSVRLDTDLLSSRPNISESHTAFGEA